MLAIKSLAFDCTKVLHSLDLVVPCSNGVERVAVLGCRPPSGDKTRLTSTEVMRSLGIQLRPLRGPPLIFIFHPKVLKLSCLPTVVPQCDSFFPSRCFTAGCHNLYNAGAVENVSEDALPIRLEQSSIAIAPDNFPRALRPRLP